MIGFEYQTMELFIKFVLPFAGALMVYFISYNVKWSPIVLLMIVAFALYAMGIGMVGNHMKSPPGTFMDRPANQPRYPEPPPQRYYPPQRQHEWDW